MVKTPLIPLPGYPWKRKFKTKEEINSYINKAKLTCLLCGRTYEDLVRHLHTSHDRSKKQYCQKYGLPEGCDFVTPHLRSQRREQLKNLEHKNNIDISVKTKPERKSKTRAKNYPLPGYPWKGVFKTPEEIEAYFDNDRLTCLLCGRTYQFLSKHLIHSHDMPVHEYKTTYGLPWKRGLVGKQLYERQKIRGQEYQKRGKLWPHLEALKKAKRKHSIQPFQIAKLTRQVKSRAWKKEDYQEVLRRISCGRIPEDVCADNDIPSHAVWLRYRKRNKKYNQQYLDLLENMPFSFQADRGTLQKSQRFTDAVRLLYQDSYNPFEIAEKLNVSYESVRQTIIKQKLDYPGKNVWVPEDYEKILRLVSEKQLHPKELCTWAELPSYGSWNRYRNNHPEYNQKFNEIWESMPFGVQAKACTLGESFQQEVGRLNQQGFHQEKIARILGVSSSTVNQALKRLKKNGSQVRPNHYTKWNEADYEKILRMIIQGYAPLKACSSRDVPSYNMWLTYRKLHPEYDRRFSAIIESMPFPFQARCRMLGNRCKEEIQKLHRRNYTQKKIAQVLGISAMSVKRIIAQLRKEESLSEFT